MGGAREFASMFKSGQYGRLFLESSSHARGKTFRIFVLPEGYTAIENTYNYTVDGVCVYGVIGGQPGWTESYGWLQDGPWQSDFYKLVNSRKEEIVAQEQARVEQKMAQEYAAKKRQQALLATYK